ncbi:aromatic ring-hydroxylating oxygenase subunit alpha [Pseudonocardia bannensis]|uniref:Rieske 2Fe-2S domain-containing protein n=1 Tax=Pseudonocardia bannensis TaxID=630973 RepID=A0A848DFG7_9PSEU|nr:aromatic ring-hydroxylating dioxygenase subunit alpha [Pseudonocardia bannensis]NMH91392.1 Rieske 2Fe-2S domain-containing protein [Pseudonocardia bannensis]
MSSTISDADIAAVIDSDQNRLVSPDGSRVARAIFSSEEIYQRELAEIFGKCWLPLGHESQLPRTGSFFTTFMGEDAVIVSRGRDGQIRVHLNACSHRGAKVCLEDTGTANTFTCPYHAWTFANDGRLVGVTFEEQYYKNPPLDKGKLGLTPVAQVDTIHGMIFATFDPNAVPLREALGGMVPFLDAIFDRREGGMEVVGQPVKWRIPTNWKIYQDNFAGDEYHIGFTHGSSLEAIRFSDEQFLAGLVHCAVDGGHGFAANFDPPDGSEPYLPLNQPVEAFSPETREYMQSCLAEAEERVSAIHLRCQLAAGTVFPNWSLLPIFHTFRVCHPKGPNEIELWAYTFVDRDAPEHVKRELAGYYNFSFGPAGIVEQDDGAIWESITRTAQGTQGSRGFSSYEMGAGTEYWHEGLGCWMTDKLSEAAQRSFFREWSRRMEGGK